MLLEAVEIKKMFGDRLILAVDHIRIYSQDRIGIVGSNGAGKTTLLRILGGWLPPDEGSVKHWGRLAYIDQFNESLPPIIRPEHARRYGVGPEFFPAMSEGEKNRYKIAHAFSDSSQILFADEPTSNLDLRGIELLEKELQNYSGALLLISHDRSLLDLVCNQIWQIDGGELTCYEGNYSAYLEQKEIERRRQQSAYEGYVTEKTRLQETVRQKKAQAVRMGRPPRGVNPSEAREAKPYYASKQKNVQNVAKALTTRLDKLEAVERPRELPRIKIDIPASSRLYSREIARAEGLTKAYPGRVLFQNAGFSIRNRQKVALVGDNGAGKTTLLNMIINGDDHIYVAPGAKFGYFNQQLNILDPEQTILENVRATSAHPLPLVRTVLARLLFKGDAAHKQVKVLSGGEKVRVAFAKVFLSDINVLVLDEPTNYLDIPSLEALEQLLADYEGTLILVSHDRYFVEQVTDSLLLLADRTITAFEGTYREMQARQKQSRPELERRLLVAETRLSEIVSRLSLLPAPDAGLEAEYTALLQEVKGLRARL